MAKKKEKKAQKTNQVQQSIQQHVRSLLKLPIKERRNELAEIEIREGRDIRSKIESELRLIQAEEDYKQDAEYFYDRDENVNTFPKDFDDFPVVKQKIFRNVNSKRRRELKNQDKSHKKDNELVERLLLYRIQHEKDRFSSHLIPDEKIKRLNTAINTEVDRIFYLYKKLSAHHTKNPTSSIYGLSNEEKDILKKIKGGYYWNKISNQRKINRIQKTNTRKQIFDKLPKPKKKEVDKLLNKLWYRKESLTNEQISLLKKAKYQESDNDHKVYDFNGKKISCLGFKEGGFANWNEDLDKRETLNHFSKPYLLLELSPYTKILQPMEIGNGERRIIDAVLNAEERGKEIKIAVEFQESHNLGKAEIAEKFKPIIERFDKLIIVCPNDAKRFYEKLESEKVFVLHYGEFQVLLKKFGLLGSSTSTKIGK